jgi:hypothetical protein
MPWISRRVVSIHGAVELVEIPNNKPVYGFEERTFSLGH